MPQPYTTADDYLPGGWYPGKKHSIGQNVARVASMGIYNPDNRDESRYNKQILSNKVANASALERARNDTLVEGERIAAAQARLGEKLRQMYPEMKPEEHARLLAAVDGGQAAVTAEAKSRADAAEAERLRRKSVGGQGDAFAEGASAAQREIAQANADITKAGEEEANVNARMEYELPTESARTKRAELNTNRLLNETTDKLTNLKSSVFDSTADQQLQTAIQTEKNKFAEANLAGAKTMGEQRMADAMNEVISSPGFAYNLQQAKLNKDASQSAGPGTIIYQPSGKILSGMVPTTSIYDTRMEGGEVTGRTPVKGYRMPGDTNSIPSTADPAPAVQSDVRVFKRNEKGGFTPTGR
jgi:hypothetical protein